MAINLRDYSRTSAQRGWGSGWPNCSASSQLATVVGNNPDGTVAARVTVHKRIARLVDLLLDECERRGYQLYGEQCGGFNCRAISGTRTASNHSWGLAVDLNWQLNPMRRPLTTNIPGWMVQLWNRYGFAWGGHYTGTPDPMHFEHMGTPADADAMTALAIAELGGASTTTTETVRKGSSGGAVRRLQEMLGIPADGEFGPATDAALRTFQRTHKLTVDGVAGPATWQALEDHMPTPAEIQRIVREIVREELATVASRADLGYARDQILTALGVDPGTAPQTRPPEELAASALPTRADVDKMVAAAVQAVTTRKP